MISELSKYNARKLGVETNRLQTIEECSELIQAICKVNRTLELGQPTEMSYFEAEKNLIEELADVSICIEQMIYLNGLEKEVADAKRKALDKVAKRYKE